MASYSKVQIEEYFDVDHDRFGENFEAKIQEFDKKYTVLNINVFTRQFNGNQEYVGWIYYSK